MTRGRWVLMRVSTAKSLRPVGIRWPNPKSRQGLLWLIATAVAVMQAGCSVWTGSIFEESDQTQYKLIEATDEYWADHPAVVEKQSVSIPSEVEGEPPRDYVVGPNDVLHINVFGQPELGSPIVTANRTLGSRVSGNGEIQLPIVDNIPVAGLTVSQIQEKLKAAFQHYIAKPWVVVEILEYRSQPIYLVGQFNNPGVQYMDRPTNVVKAIALGLGLSDTADIRSARLLRKNRVVPVDVYRLLREGAFDQNVWLMPEDTLYIPDDREQQVFVLGDVLEAGAVDMVHGRLTLSQALAQAGGLNRGGTNWKRIAVIRSLSPTRGELIVIDLRSILAGNDLPFPLMAGDIIYVPRDRLGRWNDTIRELLPTLQVIGATLQPFVQIRFLSDND